MRLSTVHARFYKSFNFDQARKLDNRVAQQPWEMFREKFYPYVTVPLDERITTVVGANESGKSHLLSVIKKAITGHGIEQRDLCRYSPFFGVAKGQTCWPHVGVGWEGVDPEDAARIGKVAGSDGVAFEHFLMFREEPSKVTLWLPNAGGSFDEYALDKAQTTALEECLPRPFEIDAEVALPNSIPFSFLSQGGEAPTASFSRAMMEKLMGAVQGVRPLFSQGAQVVGQNAQQIINAFDGLVDPMEDKLAEKELAALALGRSLLLTLGEVDPDSLSEMATAIDQQQDGYVGGLLEAVNQQLERKLNFRRYWVQDRDFSLQVATRDRELVFVISDRTGTVYTFSERSSGLRYFLSYLIQAQIHRPSSGNESILLMDEPDTFLSAEAQQDLMRVFRDLAEPAPGKEPIQVIYVTHSPFLLDKNHSERIRVLEKGTGFEGTRVVPSVSRNHYEPLRSAFGAFVGESAFVGSVNLLVEGASDQILLAGAANLIRQRTPGILDDTLDLNRMVIVPGGSAGEIPYTVFRIRGQGADKPPVVALLDADEAGLTAKDQLITDKRLKKLIKSDNVLNLLEIGQDVGGWPDNPEIEDLIPPALAHRAIELVLAEVTRFREGDAPTISLSSIEKGVAGGVSMVKAIDAIAKKAGGRIDKIAFAKSVVNACRESNSAITGDIDLYLERMRVIFRKVNTAVRGATEDAANRKLESLVAERAGLFAIDHPEFATREQGRIVLDQIEAQLDDSPEAEAIRNSIVPIRRDFKLQDDPAEIILDFEDFLHRLIGLRYAWQIEASEPSADAAAPSAKKPTKPKAKAPAARNTSNVSAKEKSAKVIDSKTVEGTEES